MAASDKKLQSFYAFNAGEYSNDLAGRTDLESFASSTRFTCNFLTQVSGGLKKFYGTRHITEKQVDDFGIRMVPFVNKYEPMVLVLYNTQDPDATGLKVGLVYGNNYKDLDIEIPLTANPLELRWQQINDRLIFCHRSVQPFTIDFYGKDENNEYKFETNIVEFKEVPYFTVGATNDYRGELQADSLTGEVTLTIPTGATNVAVYFPSVLVGQSTYTRGGEHYFSGVTDDRVPDFDSASVGDAVVSLKRIRGGVTTELCSGVVNSYIVHPKRVNNIIVAPSTSLRDYLRVRVYDSITREKVLQVVKTICPQAYIDGSMIKMLGYTDHQDGDEYYMDLSVGQVSASVTHPSQSYTYANAASYTGVHFTPDPVTVDSIDAQSTIGRKIKFFFNDDTVITPWWQSKSVSVGDYAYSNGHWYKALTAGTCGNIQPSHTHGDRSDGGVIWRYVHSGSKTASVVAVVPPSTIKVLVEDGELPKNTDNIYRNYSWSIWGKDGVHPSEIYMAGNRLGFVCNTENYGAWNAMSVTDDYFNFDTEEFGEQLDTSAIVHLIGNNEASNINWVLARKDVYMGGYSGEYHLTPSASGRSSSAYSPTSTYVQNISNMGGMPIIPLKYKQLNMFVGITGKELYTIAYDYTMDDYTPKSMGYLTQHIMDRGIKRIVALNNLDRNIYLLHDTQQLSLFNYAAEQKVMGFTELNFGADVVDFCSTYANAEVAGYVITRRNDGKITIERFAIEQPNYMFDEITQGDGTLADFQPILHFANRTVYIRYGEDFSQFIKVELDATGDVSHDPMTGVYLPQSEYFKVGVPMVSELHTQPAFGNKVEGHQQQSLSVYIRLVNSGAFEYGASVDFTKYFRHEYWNLQQEYGSGHRMFTGDMKLNIPLGYAEAQNQGEGPYPNNTAVGINIKSDTPEALNILSIQEIYK